jgi:homoserine O-acetyltransferase
MTMRNLRALLAGLGFAIVVGLLPAADYPAPQEGDFVLPNFRFRSGQTLPELRMHYRTIGAAKKDDRGVVRNAVLVLHGTGGSGVSLLRPSFAEVLFGPGGFLDASRYYVILPDGIGHGRSSKPSDGLHARFPHYNYDDMVLAQYRLLTEKLGVHHLRLVMGTSMGGMHTWVWGETYPDFMDALLPLASLPVEIAGRNRMQRRMIIDAIRNDPEWNNGDYEKQPRGLVTAVDLLILMGSSPLQMQKAAPTREAADKLLEEQVRTRMKGLDANDLLYQVDASRDYNPAPGLGRIKAPLLAVNSADDEINPPELGILEREIKRVPRGRSILIPISDRTRGHRTHSYAEIWKRYLAELLQASQPE